MRGHFRYRLCLTSHNLLTVRRHRRGRSCPAAVMGSPRGVETDRWKGSHRGNDEKRRQADRDVGPVVQAAAGAVAGGLARCVVAPLDVVKIRLQVQLEPARSGAQAAGAGKYTGLLQAAGTIVREEGVRGLWRGTVPALLLWVPYTGVQFATLGQLNQVCHLPPNAPLPCSP
jgi:solute carrier family 25 (mitochondrial thiamine pyrophosphate transporter), member 19